MFLLFYRRFLTNFTEIKNKNDFQFWQSCSSIHSYLRSEDLFRYFAQKFNFSFRYGSLNRFSRCSVIQYIQFLLGTTPEYTRIFQRKRQIIFIYNIYFENASQSHRSIYHIFSKTYHIVNLQSIQLKIFQFQLYFSKYFNFFFSFLLLSHLILAHRAQIRF